MSVSDLNGAAKAPPVILLVYEFWDAAIESLGLYYDAYPNIWLVDNHSPTDRGDEIRARFPDIRVIRTERNGGWAYAYNRALEMAAAEGFRSAYLLNSDAAPLPGAFERSLAALDASPSIAAVGSVILSWDGGIVEYDGEHHRAARERTVDEIPDGLRQTDRVHGAGMAISLDAFKAVGPFHEDYFLYHEETDWQIRASLAGWTLWVEPASRIRHMDGGSDSNANARYYRTRNHFLAYNRGVKLSDGPESFYSVLWYEAGQTDASDPDQRFAIKQGVVDGLWRKVGRRNPARSRLWVELQFIPISMATTFALRLRAWRAERRREQMLAARDSRAA